MPEKFQNKYRIPSARASWHRYNGGVYFVTICTQNREHYFGEIACGGNTVDCRDAINRVSTGTEQETEPQSGQTEMSEPQMHLTPIGRYAHKQLVNIKTHYPYAEIPLFVVMPNHIHAIVAINDEMTDDGDVAHCRDAINRVSTDKPISTTTPKGGITGNNNPMLQKCLGTVIRGLKARITHYANTNNITFAWQTRFHDHIVRNQNELNNISTYIENNVIQWQLDEFNKL